MDDGCWRAARLQRWASVLTLMALLLGACSAPVPSSSSLAAPTAAPMRAQPTATPPASLDATVAPTRSAAGQPHTQPPAEGEGSSSTVDLYAKTAPEFPTDVQWLNVDRPLSMAALRGKIVLIDFWTYGCVNCLHNLPDLKRLQEEHPDELVVIGVHSAKFTNESQTDNIRQVIQRYQLPYPVINDSKLTIWHTWDVGAWPTLVLIDASGTMANIHIGDGAYRVMKPLVVTLIREAENRGRLNRAPLDVIMKRETPPATVLSFPGKVRVDAQGNRLFIADSGHHRIVVADPRSGAVSAVIGSGQRGFADGDFASATFDSPEGMALSSDGRTLYIADTANHAIRAVDLTAKTVITIAGNGERTYAPPTEALPAKEAELSSPWDLALDGVQLYIAMAGLHQIWQLNLAAGQIAPFAGSSVEGIADGPRLEAELAQTSGLAPDGNGTLYFADPESSELRQVDLAGRGSVKTLAGGGTGLFAFGDSDGIGRDAKLQHPLGITYGDGKLYVADSYNNKIKQLDPATGAVMTLFGSERGWRDGDDPQFHEPGGIDFAAGVLYIADTNNHAVRMIDLANKQTRTLVLTGIEQFTPNADDASFGGTKVDLAAATLAPGQGTIHLSLILPEGYKVNDLAPSSVSWQVDGAITTLPADADRSEPGLKFPLELQTTFTPGSGTLIADLTVIYCKAETPDLCLIEEARISAPLTVAAGGASTLELQHTVQLPQEAR